MQTGNRLPRLFWGLRPLPQASDGPPAFGSALPDASLLAEIRFGRNRAQSGSDPRRAMLGLVELGSASIGEQLWTSLGVETGWKGDIGYARNRDLLFARLLLEEIDPSALASLVEGAYRRLLGFVRESGHPYLLRMWNHFPGINRRVGGVERYQAFCIGRARAFARAGLEKRDFPAATAIGCDAPGLEVLLLAARRPGAPIENPRQTSAYCYPACYSPRPPAFARALAFGTDEAPGLLISGTASVVGHRTMHPGQLVPQVHETISNLNAVVEASGLSCGNGQVRVPNFLKVFLRTPEHLPTVQGILDPWIRRRAQVLYLRGDVCRTDLEIEIEGLYCPPQRHPQLSSPVGAGAPQRSCPTLVRGCIQIPTT